MATKWKEQIAPPILKDTFWISLFTLIGKAAGFIIPVFLAQCFGVGRQTDVFFYLYGVVLFLGGIFVPLMDSVVVPFVAEMKQSCPEQISPFVGKIFFLSLFSLFALSVGFSSVSNFFFAPLTKFDPSALRLLQGLTWEISPVIVLMVISAFLGGILNAEKIFWLPALAPFFRSCSTLLVIYLFHSKWGIHAVTWGYSLGETVRFALLLTACWYKKLLAIPSNLILDAQLKHFFQTSLYLLLGLIAIGTCPLVDKTMASWLQPGSVTILEYGDRIYQIPITFLCTGFFVVLLSHWSEEYHTISPEKFFQNVQNSLYAIAFIAIFLTVFVLIAKEQIVQVIYQRGKFSPQYIQPVAEVMGIYFWGLLPTLIDFALLRIIIIQKSTIVFFYTSVLHFLLNFCLNLILTPLLGVKGLALSTTITHYCIGIFLYVKVSQNLKSRIS